MTEIDYSCYPRGLAHTFPFQKAMNARSDMAAVAEAYRLSSYSMGIICRFPNIRTHYTIAKVESAKFSGLGERKEDSVLCVVL